MLVEFDPTIISFAELLDVFWQSHDPTHQSFGRQYRNVLFYASEDQKQAAYDSLEAVKKRTRGAVVTAIEPAGPFTTAEDYHQKYLLRKAGNIYHDLRTAYPDEKAFRESTAAARLNGYLGCNGSAEALNQELESLGLSPASRQRLVDIVTTSCGRKFSGVTCPK